MNLIFKSLGIPKGIKPKLWRDWKWQLKNMKSYFKDQDNPFSAGTTPYYFHLINTYPCLKNIIQPTKKEFFMGSQQMKDPLGEEKHSPYPHLIHRYPDRVLFLVTDSCGVYCRYCTRKRFTGKKRSLISKQNQEKVFNYIRNNLGLREVILSGGDPLTLSDSSLEKLLKEIRSIKHIEIIRIASRMPVVCPMRMTKDLIKILKTYQPVFLMTHFNHPLELSQEVQKTLTKVADSGILMFNQTVLLNEINNHPILIQALMRRLLYLRVKPYYMFQCDPSEGSDHFRTTIENSKWIQKELWGRFSGLALPNLSLDIPEGGGKAGIVPDFLLKKEKKQWLFKGWDGLEALYINPIQENPETSFIEQQDNLKEYKKEWEILKKQSYGKAFKNSSS